MTTLQMRPKTIDMQDLRSYSANLPGHSHYSSSSRHPHQRRQQRPALQRRPATGPAPPPLVLCCNYHHLSVQLCVRGKGMTGGGFGSSSPTRPAGVPGWAPLIPRKKTSTWPPRGLRRLDTPPGRGAAPSPASDSSSTSVQQTSPGREAISSPGSFVCAQSYATAANLGPAGSRAKAPSCWGSGTRSVAAAGSKSLGRDREGSSKHTAATTATPRPSYSGQICQATVPRWCYNSGFCCRTQPQHAAVVALSSRCHHLVAEQALLAARCELLRCGKGQKETLQSSGLERLTGDSPPQTCPRHSAESASASSPVSGADSDLMTSVVTHSSEQPASVQFHFVDYFRRQKEGQRSQPAAEDHSFDDEEIKDPTVPTRIDVTITSPESESESEDGNADEEVELSSGYCTPSQGGSFVRLQLPSQWSPLSLPAKFV